MLYFIVHVTKQCRGQLILNKLNKYYFYYIFICHNRSILYIINEIIGISNRNQNKSICTKYSMLKFS